MIKKENKKLDFKIAFVAASWHEDLVNVAVNSCKSELQELGVDTEKNIKLFNVPGSLEIPLVSKTIIQSGEFDAVIAFGLVVDGGIYRHEFVAQTVLDGIMKVSLETKTPVLSVVLTPQKFDETNSEHIKFFQKHLVIKGQEAARSAVQIIQVISDLRQQDKKD
ncbi:MAG TPA: 6,7-dimethyl-8-ribityllumazine synthase [Candidatus Saccharimonadales bacterium]|nr:6,7-dimethyl-8-ribityllumazine synthase [Candidatus Saccharimonadales bacterium]